MAAAVVVLSLCAVFGTIGASVWFAPSPYYLLAVVPATFFLWLVLRENPLETLIIAIILLMLMLMLRSTVQIIREKLSAESETRISHNMVFTQRPLRGLSQQKNIP